MVKVKRKRSVKWGPGNPLWDWQHKSKTYKLAKPHRSPVRHMARRARVRRFFRRGKRRGHTDRRMPLLTTIGAVSGFILPPATSGGGTPPYKAVMDGQFNWAMEGIIENYTGYNFYAGTWNPMNAKGLMLTILGALGSKAATAVGANKAMKRIPFAGKYIKL